MRKQRFQPSILQTPTAVLESPAANSCSRPITDAKPSIQNREAAPPVYAREDLLARRFRVTKVLPYQQSSPFISNLTLAVFSGLLLIFAFPDWSLWSLGWVGTAPLIMAVVRERKFWRSMILGLVTGTVFYAGSSHWITYSMHNYGGIPLLLCYGILILFAAALGIFTGLFAAILGIATRRFGGWLTMSAPVIWAATEWLRLEVTGMGWNPLGYSQAFQPAVIQIARFGGVYLVSAVMVSAGAALVFALVYLERRRGIVVLTAVGIFAIAAVLYGESLRPDTEEPASLSVAVIQPNVPIDGAWDDPKFVDEMFQKHVLLSEQSIQANSATNSQGNGPIELVIWPESPMSFEYDREPSIRQKLASFTSRNRVYLLLNLWGIPASNGNEDALYNSAMLIAPSGGKVFEYDKNALVPFGEYVPGKSWLPFAGRVKALVGDIAAGTEVPLAEIGDARIGNLICFETTRPDIARKMRRAGASSLVQISNEAWFGPSSAPRQMLASAIFRAVENNIDVIRATNSGLSAHVDSYGIAGGETPMFDTATRSWRIRTRNEAATDQLTFYSKHGDVFAVSCAILTLLLLISSTAAPLIKRVMSDEVSDK